jgi:membrane-associated phospholipid phosphatase
MNHIVIKNFEKLKIIFLYIPIIILAIITCGLYYNNLLSKDQYINFQKDFFIFINHTLADYPITLYNITQLGDALIILSFLTIFLIYAPKLWEALIIASILSAIIVAILKPLFAIKRPAAVFSHDDFFIIGQKLMGHNSFPSGHSVTVFTVLTIVLIAFFPKGIKQQFAWCISIIIFGVLIVLTRIGVGAHHPFDIIVGGILGYLMGVSGIVLSNKYNLWASIVNKKIYPIFILLFVICSIILVFKILDTNLIIFYFALVSLLISIYVTTFLYVKK